MASAVNIEIVIDDGSAEPALRRVDGSLERLGQRGNVVFTAMKKQQRENAEAAQLLASQFGVHLPNAITKTIARTEAFGNLAKVAFAVGGIIAMGVAVLALKDRIAEAAQELGGFSKAYKDAVEEAAANNKRLALATAASAAKERDRLNEQISLLNRQAAAVEKVYAGQRNITAEEDRLVRAFHATGKTVNELRTQIQGLENDRLAAGEAANRLAKEAEKAEAGRAAAARQANAVILAAEEQLAVDRISTSKEFLAEYLGTEQERAMRTLGINLAMKDALDKQLGDFLQLNTQIIEQQVAGWEQGRAAQEKALGDQAQLNARMLDQHRMMVQTMASEFEGIWDDIFSGNIGKRLLSLAKRFFFLLLSQLLSQSKWFQNAFSFGQQSGTGLLGGILGSLFGLGGGGGGLFNFGFGSSSGAGGAAGAGSFNVNFGAGASTPGAAGGFVGPTLSNLGLSAGGSTAGMAQQQQGQVGFLQKLFGKLPRWAQGGVAGALGAGMSFFSGFQSGSPVGGLLSGVMSGAGLGMMLGGPLGWAVFGVSALAGLLGGIFGAGANKDKARRQVRQFLPQLEQTVEDYKAFRLEYEAALAQLQAIAGQAQASVAGFGKSAARTAYQGTFLPEYGRARKEIMDIERERAERRKLELSAPEFHRGGLITHGGRPAYGAPRYHGGGEVGITAETGEFVFRRAAVQSIGVNTLARMNESGSAAAAGPGVIVNLNLLAVDVPSFRSWLRGEGGEEISDALRWRRMNGAN